MINGAYIKKKLYKTKRHQHKEGWYKSLIPYTPSPKKKQQKKKKEDQTPTIGSTILTPCLIS